MLAPPPRPAKRSKSGAPPETPKPPKWQTSSGSVAPLPQETCDELLAWRRSLEFRLYPFRGRLLKRSPKLEWRREEGVGTYRWGQERRSQQWGDVGFPPPLQKLVDAAGDPNVNHVIVISYAHGEARHIPWHSDKQEGVPGSGARDIAAGTSIHNFVACDRPRVFQLAPAGDLSYYFSTGPCCAARWLPSRPRGTVCCSAACPRSRAGGAAGSPSCCAACGLPLQNPRGVRDGG